MRIRTNIIVLICWANASHAPCANAADNSLGAAQKPPVAATVSLPPLPQSPINEFRELLALGPRDLERTLAGRAEPQRLFLKAKLAEYAALTPAERELRLRATELRWYLRPLMGLAPTNRAARLATIPNDYRTLVEQRLTQWDLLSPEAQKEVLENESTIHYFLRLESTTGAARATVMIDLSAESRRKLEAELSRWRALPPERRQRMCDHFQQFFELSPKEKEKTLAALSDAERREMEKTLQAFEQLPPEQRRLYLDSFRKYASMTSEERAQFLNNVNRWKALSAAQRDAWRRLAQQLPPLPPGARQPPLPRAQPPLPGTRSGGTNAGG